MDRIKEKRGTLITFSIRTDKFKTSSEKTIFFRKLYGWKQVVPTEEKTYEYERPGILDEMPHEKVDQSSFIIPEDRTDKIMDFFEGWHNKVILKTFKVLLDNDMKRMFKQMQKLFDEENEEEEGESEEEEQSW